MWRPVGGSRRSRKVALKPARPCGIARRRSARTRSPNSRSRSNTSERRYEKYSISSAPRILRRDQGQREERAPRRATRPAASALTRPPRTRARAPAPARPTSSAGASSKAARAMRSASARVAEQARAAPSASAAAIARRHQQRVLPVAQELAAGRAGRRRRWAARPPWPRRPSSGEVWRSRHRRAQERHRDHRGPRAARPPPRACGTSARHLRRGRRGRSASTQRPHARPGRPRPAMPPRITSRARGHPRHRLHQHVDALPGIELARVEDARRPLRGQARERPVGGHVAPVGDHAHAAAARRSAR